jgi:hypothetical protein
MGRVRPRRMEISWTRGVGEIGYGKGEIEIPR